MNLRLDSESIRVRVSQEEAVHLLGAGVLSESLPVQPLWVEILVERQTEPVILSPLAPLGSGLSIKVSRDDLDRAIKGKELELHGAFVQKERSIRVSFEIDRFTLKKHSKTYP